MGDAYRQPAAHGVAKTHQAPVEFLGAGHAGQDYADVLRELLHLF